jgi:hypothetical protein
MLAMISPDKIEYETSSRGDWLHSSMATFEQEECKVYLFLGREKKNNEV